MKLEKQTLRIDNEGIACEYALKNKNAVILHGAGTSEHTRFFAIAEEFTKRGVGVLLFDFSGHGESTGELTDQTLERRRKQAQAVIDQVIPEGELYLTGFSMGAQTLCDLLPVYGDRSKAILLGCPAIYTEEVRNIPFGENIFTLKLREENSWKNSKAPELLKDFKGKTIIAIGDSDEVIPKGVIDLLRNSKSNAIYIEYSGVTHMLAKWLSENPKELTHLIERLV